jgi:TrmH family RNA methyltransferase
MPSKNKILLVERLKTRKGRPREELVLVEGVRCVREALAAEVKVRFVVRSPRLLDTEAGRALAAEISDRGVPVDEVGDDELDRMADTEHPQGVLLVCEEPRRELVPLTAPAGGPILLLDAIQDPGNLGTLIRAARAFGASMVVALDGSVDPWNAKAVRASAGASFHLGIVRAPWAEAGPWLENENVQVLAADPDGRNVSEVEPTSPWALAVGNEGAGLRPEIVAAAADKIAIPMGAGADSLNVGVAGSILLYVLTTHGSDAS